jgi:hypothetical protein
LYICEKAGKAPMVTNSTGKRKIFFILFVIICVECRCRSRATI